MNDMATKQIFGVTEQPNLYSTSELLEAAASQMRSTACLFLYAFLDVSVVVEKISNRCQVGSTNEWHPPILRNERTTRQNSMPNLRLKRFVRR